MSADAARALLNQMRAAKGWTAQVEALAAYENLMAAGGDALRREDATLWIDLVAHRCRLAFAVNGANDRAIAS